MSNAIKVQNERQEYVFVDVKEKSGQDALALELFVSLNDGLKKVKNDKPQTSEKGSLLSALEKLAKYLEEQEVNSAKFDNNKSNVNLKVADKMIEAAAGAVKEAQQNYQKLINSQSHHHWWDIFLKIVMVIVTVGVAAVCLLTGDPVAAAVILGLGIAAATGGLKDLTKLIAQGISELLVDCGVPKKTADKIAKFAAAAIVTIATVVVTAGAGSAGAVEEAVEEGVQTGVEATEETVSSTEEDTQSLFNKIKDAIKEKLPSRKVGFGMMGAAEGISSTGLFQDVGELIALIPGVDKKKLKEAMEILEMVTTLILSLVGGAAVMGGDEVGNFAGKIKDLIGNKLAVLQKLASVITSGAYLAQGSAEIASNTYKVKSAKIGEVIAALQAEITFLNEGTNELMGELKEASKDMGRDMKRSNNEYKALDTFSEVWQQAAQV